MITRQVGVYWNDVLILSNRNLLFCLVNRLYLFLFTLYFITYNYELINQVIHTYKQ